MNGTPTRGRIGLLGASVAVVCTIIFVAANAHLIMVAFASQPDCVEHTKALGAGGGYSAAKSSC